IMVVFSVAFGIGMGASAVVSRAIGEGDHHRVQQLATHALILAVLLVAVFCAIGLASMGAIFRLLGAADDLVPLIKQYMRIWFVGMVFVVVPMVGNSIIRATGDTKIPAIIMLVGAGLNAALDPLLIFGRWGLPRMELAGAALATVLSRSVTLVLSLLILRYREGLIEFVKPKLAELVASWRRVLFIGIPACLTNLVVTVLMGIMTRLVSGYGEAAVAAVGVGYRILHFPDMAVAALASSMLPFVGQNLGAGRFDRIRRALSIGHRFAIVWGIVGYAALAMAAWPLARLFSDDPAVVEKVVLFLRIVPLGMAAMGAGMLTGATLNALHRPMVSSGLRISNVVVVLGLALVGSWLWGLRGLFGGIVIGDVVVSTVAAVWLWRIVCHGPSAPGDEAVAPATEQLPSYD
ncbi:MAG: MATE family efflux transporter, partial [Planctomycetota bacterium]